jgi:hypothetical protein
MSQCQFLQWGYWTAQVNTPNAQMTGATRSDYGHINTWLAGIPTVTRPTSGVGTYSGAAIGSVGASGFALAGSGSVRAIANAGFFGPGAAGTGGNFNLSGPSYLASGIFAGKLTGPIH